MRPRAGSHEAINCQDAEKSAMLHEHDQQVWLSTHAGARAWRTGESTKPKPEPKAAHGSSPAWDPERAFSANWAPHVQRQSPGRDASAGALSAAVTVCGASLHARTYSILLLLSPTR